MFGGSIFWLNSRLIIILTAYFRRIGSFDSISEVNSYLAIGEEAFIRLISGVQTRPKFVQSDYHVDNIRQLGFQSNHLRCTVGCRNLPPFKIQDSPSNCFFIGLP